MGEDERVLNVKQGLEYTLNDNDFYKETLQIYLDETAKNAGLMDQYLQTGDLKNYTTLVHSMKSSSRLVGAVLVTVLSEKMETKSKVGDLAYVKENHSQLIDLLYSAHNAIYEYLKQE